jgi:hypothetical protein
MMRYPTIVGSVGISVEVFVTVGVFSNSSK